MPIASRRAFPATSPPGRRDGRWMHPGFDIVDARGAGAGCPVERAATAYWSIFEAFDLLWLWEGDRRAPAVRPLADAGALGAA